ncbi:MAG: hypothetical protein H7240_09945 [Glaciimonas sp.]|nr:hypothetical protein [Glaciimonas sp.]
MIFTAAVDDGIPDITTALVIDYSSELGNKLTIYLNAEDLKHIALCWGKTQHRLTKVDTTKGAERFENHKYGLVWITIPAKGMLLDSKQAHQLANEFKSLQQSVAPITSPATTLIAEPARG